MPEDPTDTSSPVDPNGEGEGITDEALTLYRELGDERGEANVLWAKGNKKYFSEQVDAGVEEFLVALQKFRNVGDRTMEAWSLHMAGGGLLRASRSDEARPYLNEALRHFYVAGDAAGITLVIDDLSAQAIADHDYERAARLWGAGRALATATGATLATFTGTYIESLLLPHVRALVDPGDLERWSAEGAKLSLDEAVAYALAISLEDLGTLRATDTD